MPPARSCTPLWMFDLVRNDLRISGSNPFGVENFQVSIYRTMRGEGPSDRAVLQVARAFSATIDDVPGVEVAPIVLSAQRPSRTGGASICIVPSEPRMKIHWHGLLQLSRQSP